MAHFAALHLRWAAVQWGDVGTWIGGLATAFALVVTWRLLLITRQEQRAARAEKHQAQARLVSAWSDHVEPAAGNERSVVTVRVRNSSHEPVYGVRAAVGATWFGDKIPHTELPLIFVVPPKSTLPHDVPLLLSQLADGSYDPAPPVEVIFYDAAHEGPWLRDRFGRLRQVSDDGSQSPAEHFFKPG